MTRANEIVDWCRNVVISDGVELREPCAADVVEYWGVTRSQASLLLASAAFNSDVGVKETVIDQRSCAYAASDSAVMAKSLMPAAFAAKLMGVSERTIRRYIEEGCPSWRERSRGHGPGTLLVRFRDVRHWRDDVPG